MDPEVLKRLRKFRLSDKDERVVEIDEADARSSWEYCKRSLVGRIFGENATNLTGLKQTMAKLSCVKGELRVIELKSKTF